MTRAAAASLLAMALIAAGTVAVTGVGHIVWAQTEDETAAPVATEEPAVEAEAASDEAAAPATPGPAGAPSDGAGLVSIDFKDADIRQVLRVIALINDGEARVGDAIADYKVMEIRKDSVVLANGGEPVVLEITFEQAPKSPSGAVTGGRQP